MDQAINYHRSFRTLVYAGFFFVMAVGLGVYLARVKGWIIAVTGGDGVMGTEVVAVTGLSLGLLMGIL
ncbi:MAG: hypothetical protein R3B93_02455 [Bacteroidia bacterium]